MKERGGRCDIDVGLEEWGRGGIRGGPGQGVGGWRAAIGEESKTDAAHGVVDAREVFGHSLGGEDVVAVLPVGEVIGGEVRAGENDLVIEAVELDMLQSPALVDALGQQALPHARQVRRVVHADLNLVGELGRQRGEQGGA